MTATEREARFRSLAVPLLAALCILPAAGGRLLAGGPLLFAEDGTPLLWDVAFPVVLHPDRGGLGGLDDPVGLLEHAVRQWNGITTAALKLEMGDTLSTDVEDLRGVRFDAFVERDDGTNPIIFDEGGSIFDDLFGPESRVLGIGGPSVIIPTSGKIIKGFAVFNGAEAASGEEELFKAVFTHEVGHLLNLDHTQINGTRRGQPVPGFSATPTLENVTTMFPVLVGRNAIPHPMSTLHKDDRVSLSALYPSGLFASTGAVTGFVLHFDGYTQIQGVNVVARNIDDPLEDSVSYVSGQPASAENNFEPSSLKGYYELKGLTPGASYTLGIEEISSQFIDGSSVGPLNPPRDLDPSDPVAFLEFWNGAGEVGTNPPDDPLDTEPVRLRAGETRERVDFVFNGVLPRGSAITPASGDYSESHEISITGFNFGDFVEARLSGPSTVVLDATPISSTEIAATVPAFVVPGDYDFAITTAKGTASIGSDAYRVTEAPPVLEFFSPEAVRNDRPATITVSGINFLGARSVRLVSVSLPAVELDGLSVNIATSLQEPTGSRPPFSFYVVVADVPAGTLPGAYRVIVTNTAGASPASADQIEVVELAPVLFGGVEPSSFNNSRDVDIRIFGDNLAGTRIVQLFKDGEVFALTILSTSLTDVTATVPAGLASGVYSVVLTNTIGSTSAAEEVTITRRSGGGGGCSAVIGADPADTIPDFPLLLLALFTLRVIMSRFGRERERWRAGGVPSPEPEGLQPDTLR